MTTIVLGGGLAGLTAAYDLARAGEPVTILESEPLFGGSGGCRSHFPSAI